MRNANKLRFLRQGKIEISFNRFGKRCEMHASKRKVNYIKYTHIEHKIHVAVNEHRQQSHQSFSAYAVEVAKHGF